MKKILCILLLALILISCEPQAVTQGRKLYERYFFKKLKDPNSFVVYEEKYETEGNVKVKWIIDYGAKNTFGDMIRETAIIETISSSLIVVNGHIYKKEDLQ